MIRKIDAFNPNIAQMSFGQKKKTDKKHFEDNSKMIITALATAAAVTTGVILASKHMQAKKMQQVGEKIIQKPHVFDEKAITELAENFIEEGKTDIGGKIAVVPKSVLQSIADSDKSYNNILKGMKMSDSAFGVTVIKSDNNIDFEALRYFDPECITVLKMVDAIKNDKIYYCEIG